MVAQGYLHCVKSVKIRSFFGLCFPVFGLNTEIYIVNLLHVLIYSIKLSTILRIHLHDGKNKLWIFYQEHPNTFRKNILPTINGKSRNGNHKNEMESITFNNNNSIDNSKEENTKWYWLKSLYDLRQVKELIPFENDLVELIRNIRFRKIRSTFQKKLKRTSN